MSWGKVPLEVATMGLKPTAVRVYIVMANRGPFCWESQENIARTLNLWQNREKDRPDAGKVRTAQGELEAAGLIVASGRHVFGGGGWTKRWLVQPLTDAAESAATRDSTDAADSSTDAAESAPTDAAEVAAQTDPELTKGTDPPSGLGFDEFWEIYPRKLGKGAAHKAFTKALELVDAAAIIDGARRLAEDPNRVDRFTRGPTRWLNEGGWDDGPLVSRETELSVVDRAMALSRERRKTELVMVREAASPVDDVSLEVDLDAS